jgi:HD-GYP domain-containing protein (c-di-GMP phosphodiesterase class II)
MRLTKEPTRFWKELFGSIAIYDAINQRNEIYDNETNKQTKEINIEDGIFDKEYQIGLEIVLGATKKYHHLFKTIFLDFDAYKLKKSDSVHQKYDTHLLSYNNRYKLLSEIDLYTHTINVVVEMIKLTKQLELPQDTIDIAILLALLHDVGKNSKISGEYQFEAANKGKHHIISANYSKHTMYNEKMSYKSKNEISDELIELIVDVLRNHHEEKVNKNLFLELLIKADTNVRVNELNGVLLKQKRKALIAKKGEN